MQGEGPTILLLQERCELRKDMNLVADVNAMPVRVNCYEDFLERGCGIESTTKNQLHSLHDLRWFPTTTFSDLSFARLL